MTQTTIYPANTLIQINPDDSGTNIQSFLQKDELSIVKQDPTNLYGNNVSLNVDSSEPNLILSKGRVDGNTPLSGTLLQSTASYINSLNNENADVQLYSTSATTKTLDIQNPPVPYVRGCSIASNAFTIGGHYADYTDGVANIKRVYTGFYRNDTPTLGAVQATTQNGLLDPNATKVDISVRSNLDMESNSINDLAGLNTTSGSTLNINRSGQTTKLIGNTDIPLGSKLTVGTGAITLYGGDGGAVYDTTTQNNIQIRIGSNARNQIYNAFISPLVSAQITLTLPTAINGTYVYVYNGSATFTHTISGQSGQLITQGIAGNGTLSIPIRPLQTMGFIQLDAGGGVFFNSIATEVINGTSIKPTTILDKDNQLGSAGQLLSSTGTALDWVNPPVSGWVGTATSNLDMDNYSVVDVNNIGMVNGTLSASSSTVATDTATLTNTGVTVGTTVLGSTYTNTITGEKTLLQTSLNSKKTEIQPATIDMSQTNSGIFSRILTGYNPSPNIGLQSSSTNDPPDFPAQNCVLSTAGLSANNSFGWNLDVPKLLLNYGASTTGQVITANATGRPIWGTTYISSTGVASGGITSLPSIDASGTLLLGTSSATTAITVGSSSATELLLIPPLKVGTLGDAGLAGQYLSSSGGSANTWTTPYVNASNGQVAGNLLLQGNNISGINSIDGNSATLRIGTQAGTQSSILIGKAGIPVDIVNTIRCGADGAVSAGSANQVITSQGAGLPTVYKFPTLATASTQQAPTISGTRFTANIQVAYNRVTITAPAVGTKYLFFLTTTVDSNNSGNTQTAYVSIGYKDGNVNVLANDVNSFNIVNNLDTAVQSVSSTTASMASARSGTITTTTQTLTSFWVYTWAGALTKSFACIFSGGVDWYLGTGRISYIQIS